MITITIIVYTVLLGFYFESREEEYPKSASYFFFVLVCLCQFWLYYHVDNLEDEAYEAGVKQGRKESVQESIDIFKKHHICKDSGDQLIELLRIK